MNPVEGDLLVSAPLTQVAANYIQDTNLYIANRVFPVIPVEEQYGEYFTFDRGDFYRREAGKRGPGAESRGGGFRIEKGVLYSADVHAFHQDVDDQTAARYRSLFDLESAATEFVTQNLLLEREQLWAATYFVPAVWGTNLEGVAAAPGAGQFLQWDQANSTPVADIRLQKRLMGRVTAVRPNTLVITEEVRDVLAMHDDITSRYMPVAGAQPVEVTDAQIAAALGIENIVVAQAVVNLAPEGAADDFATIFNNHALLVYANPRPSIFQPSGGYIFGWNGYPGANGFAERVKRFRLERNAAWRIEGEMAYGMGLVSVDLGVFFEDVIA
jgi:hypothetical protein